MDAVEQPIESYDRIASRKYCSKTREPKFLEWEEGYIRKLLSHIHRKNPLILNVGCGDGRDNIHLEKNGAKAIGIDLSKGVLQEAMKTTSQQSGFGLGLTVNFTKFRQDDTSSRASGITTRPTTLPCPGNTSHSYSWDHPTSGGHN